MAATSPWDPVPEARAALERLRAHVRGTVIEPTDHRYEQARAVWNGMIDRRPRAIVQVASVEDIAPVIAAARETGLPLAVRGGGHSIAGLGTVDDGIVLDLGELTAVEVDAEQRLVTIEPGATAADVDAATSAHGLAVPLGVVSTPGVSGMALGGGVGWLVRRAGLTADALVRAELVLASGQHVTADQDSHADLLWGLRGGGGNFGVGSSFTFRAVTMPRQVQGATLFYRRAQWRRALAAFSRWAATLPDEMSAIATFAALPASFGRGDQPWLMLRIVHLGEDPREGSAWLERLRRAAAPDEEEVGVVAWPSWQSATDEMFPAGSRAFWSNLAFSRTDEDALDTIVTFASRISRVGSGIDIHLLGGEFARVPEAATAFPNRSAPYWMNIFGFWDRAEEDRPRTDFAQSAHEVMRFLSEHGEYVNFLGSEHSRPITELSRRIYGEEKYQHLQRLKQRYDPHNLFRVNYNVSPER